MSDQYTVLALFEKVEPMVDASDSVIGKLNVETGDIEVLTSAAYPDGALVEDKEFEAKVADYQYLFPFLLGICGIGLAFLLVGGTGWIMNLNVGGKPPIFSVAVAILSYEMSLGSAVVGSVLSLFIFAKLPNWTDRAYDPDISEGAIGLLMRFSTEENRDKAADLLTNQGAYRVRLGKNDF